MFSNDNVVNYFKVLQCSGLSLHTVHTVFMPSRFFLHFYITLDKHF